MKKFLLALAGLVVALLILVLLHPLWIGPVVRTAVSQLAPKYLGVAAHLDGFSLNAYTGRMTLDGFALDNPPGCSEAKFVTVGHLCLDVNPTSVLSDPIVIEEISLTDLYVSLVTDAERTYNFTTVAETVAPREAGAKVEKPEPPEPEKKDEKPAPKVIIDLIQVQNALVQWERVPLPLPSFRMTGIGRESDGVTFEAAWKEMETKFVGSLGPLAAGLQAYVSGAQGALDSGVKAVSDVTKSVDDANKAVRDLSHALKDGSEDSADAAAKSINEAAKSIEGSVKSLKSLFGK